MRLIYSKFRIYFDILIAMEIELKYSLEKPIYSTSCTDGVSLIDVSQIRESLGLKDGGFRMAFYEPPYNKFGISSFVLEYNNRYYLYEAGKSDHVCDCTYLFRLSSHEYLPRETELKSSLRSNPEDLTTFRLLTVLQTLMNEKGIETIEEFANRF